MMGEMRERLARAICAEGGNLFCSNMGGSFGCKCGRGEPPHWERCIATEGQLYLSGNMNAADAVLAAIEAAGMVIVPREPTQAMIDAAPESWRNPAMGWRKMLDAA